MCNLVSLKVSSESKALWTLRTTIWSGVLLDMTSKKVSVETFLPRFEKRLSHLYATM
jgi:hypothetical protein